MERLGFDAVGVQTIFNAGVHFISGLTAKRQQQNLLRVCFLTAQQPASARHQHRCFAAARASQYQNRIFAIDDCAALTVVEPGSFNGVEEVTILSNHPFSPGQIAPFYAALTLFEPAQAGLIIIATVIKIIQTFNRYRYGGKSPSDVFLHISKIDTFEPFILLLNVFYFLNLPVQYPGTDVAHFNAPALPDLEQMLIKTLRFLPFRAVQAHDFFIRQFEFQLTPDNAASAADLDELIER